MIDPRITPTIEGTDNRTKDADILTLATTTRGETLHTSGDISTKESRATVKRISNTITTLATEELETKIKMGTTNPTIEVQDTQEIEPNSEIKSVSRGGIQYIYTYIYI